MQVICPKCGLPGEAGRFCEMGCGRLPAAPVEAPSVAEPVKPGAANAEGRPRLSAVMPNYLQQQVAESVVFTYGFDADTATSATVRILFGARTVAEATTTGRPGRTGKLPVNLALAQAGNLTLKVVFAYRRECEFEDEELEASLTVEVKPRASALNISYAPNVNMSGNYGTDLHGMQIANLNLPKEAFQVERPSCAAQVFELTWRRTANRMMLVAGTRIVQMLARFRVSLGRDRSNDVVLRCCDAEKGPQNEISKGISGTHLLLELDAGGCTVVDGNGCRPSTRGTHLDGVRLPPGGRKTVRNGAVKIGFGLDAVDFQLELAVASDDYGHVRGCRLTRTDAAQRQTVVLLENGEVPLGTAGERLSWDGCVFTGVTALGERVALVPGAQVELAGTRWQAVPYQPSYIHRWGCEQGF